MSLSTLGISDQILRKVGSESDSSLHPFLHPSTVPTKSPCTDKEAGTSEFKQVGQDLTSQSALAGWSSHSSSELPPFKDAAGEHADGEGATASFHSRDVWR